MKLTLLGSRNNSNVNNMSSETNSETTLSSNEKPKVLDEPLSIDDDEIPF